jgi:hypothetical protein
MAQTQAKPADKALAASKPKTRASLVENFAKRYTVDAPRVLQVLRATAFKVKQGEPAATEEELMQLLVVADIYKLNPFTRELYAFRAKGGGIVPIIGYDGWIKLVEAQPQYMGCAWEEGRNEAGDLVYYGCTMYRKDRPHPTVLREYLSENRRDTDNWRNMPNRMLRMRAYIQCARVAFGLGGIYDPDEGEGFSVSPGVDYFEGMGRQAQAPGSSTTASMAKTAEDPLITEGQLEEVREKLAKTGVPDNLVLARFEVGTFEQLKFDQVPTVLKFIEDNAP